MKIPNSSRIQTDNDSLTSDLNISNEKDDNIFVKKKLTNKTEQIRLKRNLLQSKYPIINNDLIAQENEYSDNSIIQDVPEEPKIPLINFKEAYFYFKKVIFPNGYDNKKQSKYCSCSSEKEKYEKLFIKSLTRTKYDKNNEIHFRILFKIYYFFTKKNCEKEGEHWQDIGFQSDNPFIDLISIGMFGPLQILYGIDKYPDLYKELFEYLLKKKCNLYFMVNLLSICKFSYNLLERDLLDNYVAQQSDYFIVTNEIYVGMGYEYRKEIKDYGNNNVLTIEYIVKVIQNISNLRTQVDYFIKNHQIISSY